MGGKVILAQLAVAPAAPSASYSQFYSLTTNKGYIMHPDGVARLLVAEDGNGDASITRDLAVTRNLAVTGTSALAGNVSVGAGASGSGYLISGNQTSTTGSKILGGYYSNGQVSTFGSMFSSGGPVVGYGVWPSTASDGAFVSSTSINAGRSALYSDGASWRFYIGASQSVAVDSAVTVSEIARITSTGLGVFCTPAYALDVDKSSSGAEVTIFVRNGSNTAGSNAILYAAVGGASSGDPQTNYNVEAGQSWSTGVDNSDSDKFKICKGVALGTNDYLTVTTAGNITGIDFVTTSLNTPVANKISLNSQSTGNAPSIGVSGDANAGIALGSNGSGTIYFATNGAATIQFAVLHVASATNYAYASGSNGGNPTLGTSGGNLSLTSNTNAVESLADLYIKPHGGVLSFLRLYNADSSNEAFIKDTGGTGASILTFYTAGNEVGRFTNSGYLKASNNATYSGGATTAQYEFNSSTAAATIQDGVVLANRHASDPQSVVIYTPNADPNDANPILRFIAAATTRAQMLRNGNWQNTNNSYGAISDEKMKIRRGLADSQWGDVKALARAMSKFSLKSDPGKTHIGWVAQDIESISPGLVEESDDFANTPVQLGRMFGQRGRVTLGTKTKSIKYSIAHMKAFKALGEAMERIERLEQRAGIV